MIGADRHSDNINFVSNAVKQITFVDMTDEISSMICMYSFKVW